MPRFVVGIGVCASLSVDAAAAAIDDAIKALSRAGLEVVGRSEALLNPAWGGATQVPFVNAAVVVHSPLAPAVVMSLLLAVERQAGRTRTQRRNGPRTLDLDLLWMVAAPSPSTTLGPVPLQLPHPRFLQRGFAVVPAVAALQEAGDALPLAVLRAAQRVGLEPLTRVAKKQQR